MPRRVALSHTSSNTSPRWRTRYCRSGGSHGSCQIHSAWRMTIQPEAGSGGFTNRVCSVRFGRLPAPRMPACDDLMKVCSRTDAVVRGAGRNEAAWFDYACRGNRPPWTPWLVYRTGCHVSCRCRRTLVVTTGHVLGNTGLYTIVMWGSKVTCNRRETITSKFYLYKCDSLWLKFTEIHWQK